MPQPTTEVPTHSRAATSAARNVLASIRRQSSRDRRGGPRIPLRLLASALLVALISASFLLAQDASLANRRAETLRRGINLSHWFAQAGDPKNYTKEHFDAYDTAQDMALIKAMGFSHVRFTLTCDPMFRRRQADRIPPEYLAMVDAAVKMILGHGLAIIIDIHPESDFKQKLVADDSFVEQFEDYWRALARHYSTLDPDRVFFEILNEPEFKDRYRWMGVQARIARAIREGAPQHTIIAAGANWSSSNELLAMEPLHDSNIIYNFHFYDPNIFTHQGATWSTNFQHYLSNLPYPSTPENVRAAAAQAPDPINRQSVIRYGLDQWNPPPVHAENAEAAAWAQNSDAPLHCNHVGLLRRTSHSAERPAWLPYF